MIFCFLNLLIVYLLKKKQASSKNLQLACFQILFLN